MKKSIVGVLCGGFSSEKEISFKSGINVMKNLSEKLWDSYLIKFNNNEWYVEDKEENKYSFFINDFSFKKNNLKIKFDVIFNAIHGAPGENGQIISFLELINIPYMQKGIRYKGKLTGIKGQYLMFEDQSVFNVRSNEGIVVEILIS